MTSVLLPLVSVFTLLFALLSETSLANEDDTHHEYTRELIEYALINENIVLVFNQSNPKAVAEVKSQMKYFSDRYKPLMLFGLNCDTPEDFQKSFNETVYTLTSFFWYQNRVVYVLLMDFIGEDIIYQVNATEVKNTIKWIYFGDKDHLQKYTPVACDLIYFQNDGVISIPKSALGKCLEEREDVSILTFTNVSLSQRLQYGRKLYGIELRVGVFQVKPYLEFNGSVCSSYKNKDKRAKGIFWEILNTMADFLDFKFELVCRQKKFTGIVEAIVEEKADFTSPMVPTQSRMALIDYSAPVYFDTFNFLTKRPGEVSRAFAVVRPYDIEVWLSILISIFITSYFISKLSMEYCRENYQFRVQLTYTQALWCLFGALTNQGNTVYVGPGTPVRLALSSWWIFSLTIVSGFSGTLISFLNAPSLEPPINTVDELARLVNEGEIKVGSTRGTSIQDWLKSEKYPSVYYRIGKTARENPDASGVRNFDIGAKKALAEKYALVASQSVLLSSAIKFGEENFHISNERVSMAHTSLGMPKSSPLTMPFNLVLTKLHQSGLVNKWKEDYFERYRAKSVIFKNETTIEDNRNREKPLSYAEVMGPFCIWAVGIGLSLLFFFGELLVRFKHYKQRQSMKERNIPTYPSKRKSTMFRRKFLHRKIYSPYSLKFSGKIIY